MRIDEGRPVDNETRAVTKKRDVEELAPAKAVRAYGAQSAQEREGYQAGHPGGGRGRNEHGHDLDDGDETDLHGIDMDEVPEKLRPVIIRLVDEIGHLRERQSETQHRIDYLEDRKDHDPSTGCMTRQALQGALEQVLSLDKQNGMHSSLALIGLPDWVELRRSAGLDAAEAYATEASETCVRHLRTGDRLARIDDTTLALVFVASARDEAIALLDAIRGDLEKLTVGDRHSTVVDCLTELSETSAQNNLAQADKALVLQWSKRS